MKIQITTDGSKSGTQLKVDGEVITNLTDIYFNCYSYNDRVYMSYSTEVLIGDSDMAKRETYYLVDDDIKKSMIDNDYIGEASARVLAKITDIRVK